MACDSSFISPQLTKLRHPNLLKVVSGLAETKDTLEFVTEPIISSLATVIASSAAWVLGGGWWSACIYYHTNSTVAGLMLRR